MNYSKIFNTPQDIDDMDVLMLFLGLNDCFILHEYIHFIMCLSYLETGDSMNLDIPLKGIKRSVHTFDFITEDNYNRIFNNLDTYLQSNYKIEQVYIEIYNNEPDLIS